MRTPYYVHVQPSDTRVYVMTTLAEWKLLLLCLSFAVKAHFCSRRCRFGFIITHTHLVGCVCARTGTDFAHASQPLSDSLQRVFLGVSSVYCESFKGKGGRGPKAPCCRNSHLELGGSEEVIADVTCCSGGNGSSGSCEDGGGLSGSGGGAASSSVLASGRHLAVEDGLCKRELHTRPYHRCETLGMYATAIDAALAFPRYLGQG